MNISIKLDSPIEFINITPVNPLISKCHIKVCWVGDEPNRNKTVITKETAIEMANSLPGSPIVGFFNEANEDFEEHNKTIKISNGTFKIEDDTRPYGFVDLGAKVWFQKFLDNGIEREYLMTEGYLWTGQYPECKRIIEVGNNQSMELDEETLKTTTVVGNNGKPQFFIINDAIFSKLCILGEDCEPCFEGANITAPVIQFSLGDNFKETMYSMMNELKTYLNEGGVNKVFNTYAVEIGDTLWSALWEAIDKFRAPNGERAYGITGIFEEETQKFVIIREYATQNLFRINFTYDEDGLRLDSEMTEVELAYLPVEPQFSEEAILAYAASLEVEPETEPAEVVEEEVEEIVEEVTEEVETEVVEEVVEEVVVEEVVVEDTVPASEFSALQEQFNTLQATYDQAIEELNSLREFKAQIDKQAKEAMVANFYMLSDEDKSEVVNNLDTLSVEEIESKLSVISYRNKVNFSLSDNKQNDSTTFNVEEIEVSDSTPDWLKAVRNVAKNMI